MWFAEFVLAAIIALAFVAIFSYGFRRPGPWGGFLWFFLLVFLGAWAVGVWAQPVGPTAWGVAWVPIFFGALLIALLVAAIPPAAPRTTTEGVEEAPGDVAAVGAFFWLLLILLIVAVALSFAF